MDMYYDQTTKKWKRRPSNFTKHPLTQSSPEQIAQVNRTPGLAERAGRMLSPGSQRVANPYQMGRGVDWGEPRRTVQRMGQTAARMLSPGSQRVANPYQMNLGLKMPELPGRKLIQAKPSIYEAVTPQRPLVPQEPLIPRQGLIPQEPLIPRELSRPRSPVLPRGQIAAASPRSPEWETVQGGPAVRMPIKKEEPQPVRKSVAEMNPTDMDKLLDKATNQRMWETVEGGPVVRMPVPERKGIPAAAPTKETKPATTPALGKRSEKAAQSAQAIPENLVTQAMAMPAEERPVDIMRGMQRTYFDPKTMQEYATFREALKGKVSPETFRAEERAHELALEDLKARAGIEAARIMAESKQGTAPWEYIEDEALIPGKTGGRYAFNRRTRELVNLEGSAETVPGAPQAAGQNLSDEQVATLMRSAKSPEEAYSYYRMLSDERRQKVKRMLKEMQESEEED